MPAHRHRRLTLRAGRGGTRMQESAIAAPPVAIDELPQGHEAVRSGVATTREPKEAPA
jgi:hypothetical protein